MTKLMEWLSVFVVVVSIWWALITNTIENRLIHDDPQLLYFAPIALILLFGLYSATVVLYRVFTFNNCEEAAAELQKEIEEAKEDLLKKGFIFKA